MLSGLFKDASWWTKFLISIFVILISLVIFSVIGLLVAIPLFNVDIFNIETAMNAENPENAAFMKYFQSVSSIGIFVLPSFIIAYLLSKDSFKYLSLKNKSTAQIYILIIPLLIFSVPFINFLAEWNSKLSLPESLSGIELFIKESETNAESLTKLFLQADTLSTLLINIFVIALIPAVGEELMFRGVFQNLFIAWTRNKHLGIFMTAILFSTIHLQFYGFVPRMFLGVLFGYLLIWSGNMYLPIFAHFINNSFAVIAYYLADKSLINTNPDEIGTGEMGLAQAAFSFIMIFVLSYAIYKLIDDKKKAL